MEFFLVPLLAIATVTFCIYKLTELIFHIHLSCRLLILLVGFAWLISLVLPGLFFHTAGFLGSVGLSLVSAVGFAWLATTYDARTQASHPISIINASEPLPATEAVWPPSTETAFLIEVVREEQTEIREAVVTQEREQEAQIYSLPEPSLLLVDVLPEQSDLSPQVSVEAVILSAYPTVVREIESEADLQEEVVVEEAPLQEPVEPVVGNPVPRQDFISEIIVAEAVEVEVAEIEDNEIEEYEQPISDSLEDLLDFAFTQRDKQHTTSALDTFRLIKHLYSDSDALPMVVAEIVSTLQSQGDYAGATAELAEILQLPEVRKHGHLVQVFEQKLIELQTGTNRTVE